MNKDGHKLILLGYVDDILVSYALKELMTDFKMWLADTFELNDLGVPRYFLGLELDRSKEWHCTKLNKICA